MKKQTLHQIAVSVLFLFFCCLPTQGQSLEPLMTIEVPFDFQVNEKVLPAGKYVIKRDSQSPQLLLIQCAERKIMMTVHTMPLDLSKQQARASLTFNEYGEKHFLSEVKFAGYGYGHSLFESKAERKLAQATKTKITPNGDSANN